MIKNTPTVSEILNILEPVKSPKYVIINVYRGIVKLWARGGGRKYAFFTANKCLSTWRSLRTTVLRYPSQESSIIWNSIRTILICTSSREIVVDSTCFYICPIVLVTQNTKTSRNYFHAIGLLYVHARSRSLMNECLLETERDSSFYVVSLSVDE